MLPELVEGLRYARRTPDIFLVVITLGFLGTFGYNFNVVVPLVAKFVVASGPAGLGALTAAMGVGSLVAALFLAYRSWPNRKVLLLSAFLFSLLWFGVGLASRLLPCLILLFLVGGAGVVFMTTCNIRLQLLSPAHLRGRMTSLYSLLFVGTTPISSLLIGFLAEKTGVRQSILEMSAMCLLGVLIGFAYASRSHVLSLPDLVVRAPMKPSGPVLVEATESEGREASRGRETS
jgi:MFS family permease